MKSCSGPVPKLPERMQEASRGAYPQGPWLLPSYNMRSLVHRRASVAPLSGSSDLTQKSDSQRTTHADFQNVLDRVVFRYIRCTLNASYQAVRARICVWRKQWPWLCLQEKSSNYRLDITNLYVQTSISNTKRTSLETIQLTGRCAAPARNLAAPQAQRLDL